MCNLRPCHYCRIVEETESSPVVVEEIAVNFFSLLENILRTENLASTSVVCAPFIRLPYIFFNGSPFGFHVVTPALWFLSWRIKSKCGRHLQPAPSTCGSRPSRAGPTWFFRRCSFLQERQKVSSNDRTKGKRSDYPPHPMLLMHFRFLLSLLIRRHDGAPQWVFSICWIFGGNSAVEVDW